MVDTKKEQERNEKPVKLLNGVGEMNRGQISGFCTLRV